MTNIIFQCALVVFLEVVLSFDNSLMIARLLQKVPTEKRRYFLKLGLLSAAILRFLLLISLTFIGKIPFIDLIGGSYLVYLGVSDWVQEKKPKSAQFSPSLTKTFIKIELLDLLFALDSLLAVIAVLGIPLNSLETSPLLPVVYIGIIIGLIAVRISAHTIGFIFSHFPRLEKGISILIAVTGVKLFLDHFAIPSSIPFFIAAATAIGYGFSLFKRGEDKGKPHK